MVYGGIRMFTTKSINIEIDFYKSLYKKYYEILRTLPSGKLILKYERGKWRTYLNRNGKITYLSSKKAPLLISRLMEKHLLSCALKRIKHNIDVLSHIGCELYDIEMLSLQYISSELDKKKGRGLKSAEYIKFSSLTTSYTNDEQNWLSKHSKQNPYKPENKIHRTPAGNMVRSKSELLIATFLEMKGIPYKYEEMIIIDGREYYPDFIIRRPSDGKIIIWEHLGMMDDDLYAEKNINKIISYIRSGLALGDNLILTYDDSGSFNMSIIEKIYEMMLI